MIIEDLYEDRGEFVDDMDREDESFVSITSFSLFVVERLDRIGDAWVSLMDRGKKIDLFLACSISLSMSEQVARMFLEQLAGEIRRAHSSTLFKSFWMRSGVILLE